MRIRAFLLHSYLFWASFSLLNFGYLWFLAVPLLPLIIVPWALRIFPFLWWPTMLAVAASVLVTLAVGIGTRRWKHRLVLSVTLAYLFNSIFLLVLQAAAEREKNLAIAAQLNDRHPTCVNVNSFFTSLINAGDGFREHALFKENGKTFYWSYSTMSFYEGNESLDRNFPCMLPGPVLVY